VGKKIQPFDYIPDILTGSLIHLKIEMIMPKLKLNRKDAEKKIFIE